MRECDYLIVGAGSSGCVLAARLTEDRQCSVLLLEAGGPDNSVWISIPAGFTKLLASRNRYTWPFKSEPEPATAGRSLPIPRGRCLGGSSSINGLLYVRGQPEDYDRWAEAGANGWSYRDVLPYFLRLENFPGDDPDRGHAGPMHISVKTPDAAARRFLDAAEAEGIRRNKDYNNGQQEGVGCFQASQRRGRRWSAADGYLRPAMGRPNLQVETRAHVLNLVLEGKRCVGVRYLKDGKIEEVRAVREVLLCAGAVQSPQILELSGIGRPEVLQAQGVQVRHTLPGVGEHYRDHFGATLTWRLKDVVTFNERSSGVRLAGEVLRYAVNRSGLLATSISTSYGFVKTKPELPSPDVQFHVVSASFGSSGMAKRSRTLESEPGMSILVYQCRPESMGSIHIASADPLSSPRIVTNFLATENDRRTFVDGVRLARKIMSSPVMDPIKVGETGLGAEARSDEKMLDFLRKTGGTCYHAVGTCRMGEGPDAVVDSRLRVHGMEGLRVIDASIMPSLVSGNTNAASLMIGEKGADMLKASA